jgi:uncharacterized membrane protein
MSITKNLERLGKKRVIAGWIAVIATLLLSAEILWTIEELWPVLEMWSKLVIIMSTFLVVAMFGWRSNPSQKSGGVL